MVVIMNKPILPSSSFVIDTQGYAACMFSIIGWLIYIIFVVWFWSINICWYWNYSYHKISLIIIMNLKTKFNIILIIINLIFRFYLVWYHQILTLIDLFREKSFITYIPCRHFGIIKLASMAGCYRLLWISLVWQPYCDNFIDRKCIYSTFSSSKTILPDFNWTMRCVDVGVGFLVSFKGFSILPIEQITYIFNLGLMSC